MNKVKCSAAGKALAECRWGKSGGKKKKKAAAKAKSSAPPRRSRRLAGVTARQPEPKKKPPRKHRSEVRLAKRLRTFWFLGSIRPEVT